MALTQAQVDALAAAPTKAALDALVSTNPGSTGDMTSSVRCPNCVTCPQCADCDTCANCLRCQSCDNCKRCESSSFLSHCFDCKECNGRHNDNSTQLYRCVSCTNCDRCIGLIGCSNESLSVCGVTVTDAQFQAIFATVEAAG
jgi:hypothetical protein